MNEYQNFASFQIESLDGKYVCNVEDAMIDNLPVVAADIPPARRNTSAFSHLDGLVFDDVEGKSEVEAVIGIGHADAFVVEDVRQGSLRADAKEPQAWKTKFGWTLVGVAGKKEDKDKHTIVSHWANVEADEKSLREEVGLYFGAEFKPHHDFDGYSKEQRDAFKQLDEGVKFDKELGRYTAPVPFKGGREAATEKINAADSRTMALKRLVSLRRNLSKNPEKKEKVFAEMEKFLKTGVVEQIDDDGDAAKAFGPVWNLPVHIVSKPDQPSKCRFCMDARATADGTCLNNCITGITNCLIPIQQPSRDFRDPRYVCTFDVKEFFHRVMVHVRDRDVFRFFFFKDRSMTAHQLFRWAVHIFGAASSPTVTAFVLRHHADEIAHLFEEYVIDTIKNRFYVDDGSGGKNSPEEYKKFVRDINDAMEMGGFALDKWKFSHPELLGLPPAKTGEEITKFLGLQWNLKDDTLSIAVKDFKAPDAKTPREMVKTGARIFDMEGWFIPFIVTGRGITQESMSGLFWGWDKICAIATQKKHKDWASQIKHLARYYIPRCWNTPETVGCVPELHLFCDASEWAFGACAYRVVKGTNNVYHSTIITAKGHVVPTDPKRASHHNKMPRLELVAAIKALDVRKNCEKLARKIEKTGEKFSRVVMWTDSEAVLKQIFDVTTAPKGFVGNRIARIQDETTIDEWRYVPGTRNPADYITRGIRADEPEKWAIFHQGPDFLRDDESRWPEMTVNRHPTPPDPVVIYSSSVAFPTSAAILKIADSEGNWYKKVLRIASCVRALRLWKIARGKKNANQTNLTSISMSDPATTDSEGGTTPAEASTAPSGGDSAPALPRWIDTSAWPQVNGADFRQAEMALIRAIQEQHWGEEKAQMRGWEIRSPTARDEIPRKSSIYTLNPFLGSDDLIRVGSRLGNASIDEEMKFPAILPKDNEHVKSLIRQTHVDTLHAGPLHVLAELRKRFWVVQGLPTIKKAVGVCPDCQRADKKPCEQKMAPLPAQRVVDTHAFSTCGVDMMGPFAVKRPNSRASHKVYVTVFTCFATRSVHFELVENMDADSFINALMRFMARRPGLTHLYSDNGSNFQGAFNIINKKAKELALSAAPTSHVVSSKDLRAVCESVAPRLLKEGIQWTFLPPYASHYAGVWERIVGLVKRHLGRVSNGDKLHYDTFHTVIVQIEGILNDRPLTSVPTDVADMAECRPLRPRHILHPSFPNDTSPSLVDDAPGDEGGSFRFRFEQARERVRAFWKAWVTDYITLLTNRKKWSKTEKNLEVDDLVIIVDDSIQRSAWEMGRVVQVDDAVNHARKIFVRRPFPSSKVICRDRTKLVHLELDEPN